MAEKERTYIAIDLKSFYASVECVERGLNPLTTHLVVADKRRTEKTICLAVSPSLKEYGIPGRPRLFQVVQKVEEANRLRARYAPGHTFSGASADALELKANPALAIDYVVAIPRMAHYMEWSTRIYEIYLGFVAPEDIHVYSIDEVFVDVTDYLGTYGLTPRELGAKMIRAVLEDTGITAAAGIGTNLYLAKVAMDIVAKHIAPDENGARIACLDEREYRRQLWDYEPLTDFWRVGRGYRDKLHEHGLFTMGDIARCSLGKARDYHNEELLYRLFGVNAELLIDHAWGWEPCRMEDIKAYKPQSNSIGSGQVLPCPYSFERARLVVREMADLVALELVDKGLVTDQMVLTVGYDRENLADGHGSGRYQGAVTTDRYGRKVPKHGHGTANLERPVSSARLITEAVMELFDRIVSPELMIRRIYLTACRVTDEALAGSRKMAEQLDMFTDYEALERQRREEEEQLEREKRMQKAVVDIKKKFGRNAILKGMNLVEGATAKERNGQIGGHKA
ncbi:MAG: DNA methylase [Hungatella sp.]|jgi:DNA polymerase V|nr:DNA methylase [Hungatella sp.]